MLRVHNQAKQDASPGPSLAMVAPRGDHQVAWSPDQSKIHRSPDCLQVPQGIQPMNGMHKLNREQQGKVKAEDER
jgi:hypothetical protein